LPIFGDLEYDNFVTSIAMAQTLYSSYMHIVFSTKNRFDFIPAELDDELYGYIGGILRNHECKLLQGGGTANHSHLLASLNKNHLVPPLIGIVKRESSSWIKTKGRMLAKFAWQDGYSAFSVGHTQIPTVQRYVANQREHHKQKLFEDEMRGFYRKYDIEFDERYVWD
jgi:REP element-mobilizing transposase RayT